MTVQLTAVVHRRRCSSSFDTCVLFLLFLTFDSVHAQSPGISWGAVGLSWVLSTLTTCILIAVAFAIRSCLRQRRKESKAASEAEAEDGVVPVIDVHNAISSRKLPSDPRVVGQPAQTEPRKIQSKRERSQGDPREYVEQWCEEQAQRSSVVAAIQNVPAVKGTATHEDHLSRYPADLDLPYRETTQSGKADKRKATVKDEAGSPVRVDAEPKIPSSSKVPETAGISSKPESKHKVESAGVPVVKRVARGDDTETPQVVSKSGTIEELKSSPLRLRKHLREAVMRKDQTGSTTKQQVLEFKRPPDEYHITSDKPEDKAQDQTERTAAETEEHVESGSEMSSSTSEEEHSDEEHSTANVNVDRTVPTKTGEVRTTSEKEVQHSDTTSSARPVPHVVESTPPTPARPASARRSRHHVKPGKQSAVPVPADGISPPPGLLPLTASVRPQASKTSKQTAATASRALEITKRKQEVPMTDEEKMSEKKAKTGKREMEKRLASLDFARKKRDSTGSEIQFLEPELQGTSTPALKPKSAFQPASVPLLLRHSGGGGDDDDESENDMNMQKELVQAPSSIPQFSVTVQSHHFHGLLSNDGLQEMAHSLHPVWRQLANILHVSVERQLRLVENHPGDSERCAFDMLRGWRDKNLRSKDEIRSMLYNALVAVKQLELAERLIQEEMVGSSERLDGVKLVSVV